MFRQVLQKLVAVLLLLVCPSTLLMAELPSAILYANGAVTLNGNPVSKSVSVFAGDRIDTGEASVVSINRSGSTMVVDPNSSVQYRPDAFTVVKGTARVRTAKGMSAHAGPISVIPKTDSALFDISSDGKTILVASREGALTVTDGTESATVSPGFTAKVSLVDAQDQDSRQGASSADQDKGPNPAATTGGESKSKKKLIIIILASVAAGAIIACILACGGGGRTAVSPVTP